MRALYTLLLILLTPFVLLRLLWRSRSLPEYRMRIRERFGIVARPPQSIEAWVHAVSVGEALAALPLIRRLVELHGPGRIWVTTTTPTGSERIVDALGDSVLHSYAPYDLPGAVWMFLRRVRPRRVVIMETELWPNLFAILGRRRIPLMIANARLSPRSFAGYSRIRGVVRRMLRAVRIVAAQSQADGERFSALAAPRVEVVGNIKFDNEMTVQAAEKALRLRALLGAGRPCWAAVSTHHGEEDAALTAHRALLQSLPDALLILVPRHPQRFDDVAELCTQLGLSVWRRSALGPEFSTLPRGEAPLVLLGDSMGEMGVYLGATDLAFVGGSLAAVGGHNVLEPAVLGLPVVFGPNMFNFEDARALLIGENAALEIPDETGLPGVVAWALSNPDEAREMGERGRAAVLANRGALDRLLALFESPAMQPAPGSDPLAARPAS